MAYLYRKVGREDLDLLVKTRIDMLTAVNNLNAEADFAPVSKSCRDYYLKSFDLDIHVAYLAYDGEQVIGCGGISFYQVMPNFKNPSGMKAYIMNIHTIPAYRGQGIASEIMRLLVREAHQRNIHKISLEASDMGKPIYEKLGFVPDDSYMVRKEE